MAHTPVIAVVCYLKLSMRVWCGHVTTCLADQAVTDKEAAPTSEDPRTY